jgi:hypothetical protein
MRPERLHKLISEFNGAIDKARTVHFEKTGRVSPAEVLAEVKASHPDAWEAVKESLAEQAALREVRRAIKNAPYVIDEQQNFFADLLPVPTIWVKDTLCATESLTVAEYRKVTEALDHRHNGIVKRSSIDAKEVAMYGRLLKKIETYSRGDDSLTVGDALRRGERKGRSG